MELEIMSLNDSKLGEVEVVSDGDEGSTLFLDPGDTISANLTYIEHLKTPQHAFVCRGSGHKN